MCLLIRARLAFVQQWNFPKFVKELREFLGFTGYYKRIVKIYGTITRHLTDLLKKAQFEWISRAQAAFEALKLAMVYAPVLTLSDFFELFVVESDVSSYCIGTVLMQNMCGLFQL